jgi:ABC-type microcin C transport system duplicated ATPase subunit YejF
MSNTASELARLRAALAVAEARAEVAESELAQTRAVVSCSEAMIQELKLEIAKLRRDKYGISSERRARLIDQLELQLEELETAATEDGLAAEQVAGKATTVRAFTRRHRQNGAVVHQKTELQVPEPADNRNRKTGEF